MTSPKTTTKVDGALITPFIASDDALRLQEIANQKKIHPHEAFREALEELVAAFRRHQLDPIIYPLFIKTDQKEELRLMSIELHIGQGELIHMAIGRYVSNH